MGWFYLGTVMEERSNSNQQNIYEIEQQSVHN